MIQIKRKLLAHFEQVRNNRISSEDKKKFSQFFHQFLDDNFEEFTYKAVLWEGEDPEDVIINIFNIIEEFKLISLSNSIPKFLKNQIEYSQLLSGFSYNIYYQVLCLQKNTFASGVLETDLSLILMLSLTYFPEEADLIGKQFLKVLENHKEKEEENNYYNGRVKEMFGYSDIIWLSSIVSKCYGKEDMSGKISNYCSENANPIYEKAVSNLFSMDEAIVNTWVDEMVDFHIRNSKNDLTLPFNHEEWQYFPIEIISLLELRLRKGFEISFIENSFLKEFLPHLGISVPIELDEFTQKLKTRVTG
ncbi:hypothetical protein AAG747_28815 [Rapidithrix thailandica]|uniref:Uncharacterized protein n=1 Tax=Rapidithrix thailandica TaxID=413964 RepID=A0AAW9SM86_9BACT